MSLKKLIIHADGLSRGNPGLAAIGATVKDEQGTLLAAVSQRIGRVTNNQAEYRALIAALREALKLDAAGVQVFMDSELVVRQVTGRYRVKNPGLKPLYDEVKALQSRFSAFRINHVLRTRNAEADGLANAAADKPY